MLATLRLSALIAAVCLSGCETVVEPGTDAGMGGKADDPDRLEGDGGGPAGIVVSTEARSAMASAASYELHSSGEWRRYYEVMGLIYLYRAAGHVHNPPDGFDREALLPLILEASDEILLKYQNVCGPEHDGDGADFSDGCAHLGGSDRGSSNTIAVLEAALLLFEIGSTELRPTARLYFDRGLRATAHMNNEHRVTSPCLGWESDYVNGVVGDDRIKWNKSNRWIAANYLVWRIRDQFGDLVAGDGAPYRQNALDATACFLADLRESSKYRCNGGARCFDEPAGPWWTSWHSAYDSVANLGRIDEDASHGNATAISFYYMHRAGALDGAGRQRLLRHFVERRFHSPRTQWHIPQYKDSDRFQGGACASGSNCAITSEDVGEHNSSSNSGWLMLSAVSDQEDAHGKILGMTPRWSSFSGGDYRALLAGAWAVYAEVGAPEDL